MGYLFAFTMCFIVNDVVEYFFPGVFAAGRRVIAVVVAAVAAFLEATGI